MAFEQDLVTHLMAQTSLTNLIGTRLHPQFAAEGTTTPYCTYLLVSSVSEYAQEETAKLDYDIQLSIFGERYSQVVAIREVLMTLLSGYKGTIGEPVVCLHKGTRSFYEADTQLHHTAVTFRFIV